MSNREKLNILNESFTFYDVYATKEKQYGFRLETTNNRIIVCNGDETLNKKGFYFSTDMITVTCFS